MSQMKFQRSRPTFEKIEWHPHTSLIWHPDEVVTHYEQPVNAYCYFRKTFHIGGAVTQGELRIFADSRYMLFVNGHYLHRGPCRSDPRWQYYDTIDLTGLLNRGDNVIAVLALHFGYGTGQSISRIPALMAEGKFFLENGETLVIPSDSSWKCAKPRTFERNSPRINGCQGAIEIFNAQEEEEGWNRLEYDDTRWEQAKGRGMKLSPFWNLVPRDIPLLQEELIYARRLINRGTVKEMPQPSSRLHVQIIAEEDGIHIADSLSSPPQSVAVPPCRSGEAAVLTFDLGRIEAGCLTLEVMGGAGDVIDAVYAEELWEGKALLNANNNRSIDRFILKEGLNRFEVAFAWKACRYVQLRIRNRQKEVVVQQVGMRTRSYPISEHSVFEAGEQEVTKIWSISEHTLRLCMQDAFVDSPSREQQQWMGDGRWQAVMNYYYTGDSRLHRKLQQQIGQSQDCTGMTCSRYPDGHHNYPPIPSFCLQWVCSFGDYGFYTGDDSLLPDWWPNILQALRWFSAYENERGLLEDVPYWSFIDWGETPSGPDLDVDRGGIVTALNLQYLEALRFAAGSAPKMGDHEAEIFLRDKAARLAKSIEDLLWDSRRGAYVDCLVKGVLSVTISEPTNSLALLHLHEPGEERSAAILQSVFAVGSSGGASSSSRPVAASPYFMPVVCRALLKVNAADTALRLIRQRYGAMVDAGSTTTWERWELFHPPGPNEKVTFSSASHAWGAAPLIFFMEGVLGVRPVEPGFRRFQLQPCLGELPWASGSIVTPAGTIRIELAREDRGIAVRLSIPTGCAAVLGGLELGGGEHRVRI